MAIRQEKMSLLRRLKILISVWFPKTVSKHLNDSQCNNETFIDLFWRESRKLSLTADNKVDENVRLPQRREIYGKRMYIIFQERYH